MAKKSKSGIVVIILLVILLAVVGGIAYMIYNAVNNDIKGINQPDTEYTLVVEKQDFEYEIGEKLKAGGIVVNSSLWSNWMTSHYPDFKYINGEYVLTADMSYEDIANKLQNPDLSHMTVKVAIPEGYNVFEIAKTLEENGICKADAFLEVCKSTDGYEYKFLESVPDSKLIPYKLEGFLFPATYDFAQNTEPKEIADKMLKTFGERYTDSMDEFCKKHDMTLYELLTLASVVQEEALTNDSAANIASVFMNRLKKGSKLQSDVTYFYAKTLRDDYGFSQETYDAYYSYRCDGLPAGPITNSGEDIINATVNYPETKYLYFFSDLKQEFHFAETYDEFVALQEKYPWKE